MSDHGHPGLLRHRGSLRPRRRLLRLAREALVAVLELDAADLVGDPRGAGDEDELPGRVLVEQLI